MKTQTIQLTLLSLVLLFTTACSRTDSRVALIEAHDQAVHIHDHWIRDPFIYLHTDGYYYMTGTTRFSEEDEVVGIPAWRSTDLLNWEKLPRLWSFADSSWMQSIESPHVEENGPLVWAPTTFITVLRTA